MSADGNGAQLLGAHLDAQGVEYVFGIPGAKVDPVFNALVGSKIKTARRQAGFPMGRGRAYALRARGGDHGSGW